MRIINKIKPTTFLVLGVLLMIISIIMFFYYLDRPGGESMASFLYLIFIGISIIMIIIDRILVNFIKIRRLSIYEFVFLIVGIIAVFLIVSCGQKKDEKLGSSTSEYYVTSKSFGVISNKISLKSLDSLKSTIGYRNFGSTKDTNTVLGTAMSIVSKDLINNELEPNLFYLLNREILIDSIVKFHIIHLDYFVYKHNWEAKNKQLESEPTKDGYYYSIPPITGNICGFEAFYYINVNLKTLEKYDAQ